MYFPRTRALREEFEYTQQYVANYLNCKRTTYESWETGHIILPLNIANKLATLYDVPISYVLGTDTIRFVENPIKEIDYDFMINKFNELKKYNNDSFEDISRYIDTNKSTTYRYFSGKIKIPTDKLILLCEYYHINIDEVCGTNNKHKVNL